MAQQVLLLPIRVVGSVDNEDRRERRFRAAPPQRKRPTPIALPAANFVGELCVILFVIRKLGSPGQTRSRHHRRPVPYMVEPESMSELVGKEFREERMVYTTLVSPGTPDDPDTSWVGPYACPATCSLCYFWFFLVGDEPDRDPACPLAVTDTLLDSTPVSCQGRSKLDHRGGGKLDHLAVGRSA